MAVPQARIDQLRRCLPQIFEQAGKLLYVGASYRAECLSELREAGHEITVLEIWPDNVWILTPDERIDHLVQGDVANPPALPHDHYDIAFWWHGPEHLAKDETKVTLKHLEDIADLVILGCPHGTYKLGPQYGNPYEAHRSAWYINDFEALGYQAEPLDDRVDEADSHLLAWRNNATV